MASDEADIQEAARLLNSMTDADLQMLVGLLDSRVVQALAQLKQAQQEENNLWSSGDGTSAVSGRPAKGGHGGEYGHGGKDFGGRKGDHGGYSNKGDYGGYNNRGDYGGHKGGYYKGGGGGGGGGGKGSGKERGKGGRGPAGPVLPPLDCPEELPGVTQQTGEQVAFQAAVGTPWRLLGPAGSTFRWDLQDRESVPDSTKGEVRDLLRDYALENNIDLSHGSGVKLALRRGDYWISFAGGISSAQGRDDSSRSGGKNRKGGKDYAEVGAD